MQPIVVPEDDDGPTHGDFDHEEDPFLFHGDDARVRALTTNDGDTWWVETDPTDDVTQIAVHPEGRVYSGDDDGYIIAWDFDGNMEWDHEHEANAGIRGIALDLDGYIYVVSQSDFLEKINDSGGSEWTEPGLLGTYHSVSIDLDGNIYMSGFDPNIIKLDADRNFQWDWDGPPTTAHVVAAAGDGRVLLGAEDGYVRQFDADDGSVDWDADVGSIVRHIAFDADGFAYIGASHTVYKLDSGGNEADAYTYADSAVQGLAVDFFDYVYIGESDGYVHRIGPDGTREWESNEPLDTAEGMDTEHGRHPIFW